MNVCNKIIIAYIITIVLIQIFFVTKISAQQCNTTPQDNLSCTQGGVALCTGYICSPSTTNCSSPQQSGATETFSEAQEICAQCKDGCCEIYSDLQRYYIATCYLNTGQQTPTPTPTIPSDECIEKGLGDSCFGAHPIECQYFPGSLKKRCCKNNSFCPQVTPTIFPQPHPYPCNDLNQDDCSKQPQCYFDNNTCQARIGALKCNQICKPNQSEPDSEFCVLGCGKCELIDDYYRCVTENNSIYPPRGTDVYYDPCRGLAQPNNCRLCYEQENTWTALGCIPTNPTQFTAALVRALFGIAGGIGFLIIIYGAFLCLTARGDAQKTQACRETITAAVIGLLLLIFSIFIINLIFGPYGFLPGYMNIF